MIQTVTGAVSKTDFGRVLMHEHVSCSSPSFVRTFKDAWLDKSALVKLAAETLRETKQAYGLGMMVDGTPIDLGRDAALLKATSEQSGIPIVASTGFYYLQSIEFLNNSVDALASRLIDECKNGIEGTDVMPGILKCATGDVGITPDNQKKLAVMAAVQGATGLPLYVHCEHRDDIVEKQLAILTQAGASVEKIIIGHTSIRPDADYLEEILKHGCYICMDQCHCYDKRLGEIASALATLCQRGYTKQILISNDYCIHSDFCPHEKNGLHLNAAQHTANLGYVFEKLRQEFMRAGGGETRWEEMLCKNPIAALDV